LNELETNSKKKNIRNLYRYITDLKGYKSRINFVEDENGDLLADSRSILNGWKNVFSHVADVLGITNLGILKFIQLSH
jgi:hypothetical protein